MKISALDMEEPDCEAYIDFTLQLAAINGLKNKRFVKALVVKGDTKEILLSWKIMKKCGIISENFPFPPARTVSLPAMFLKRMMFHLDQLQQRH